MKNLTQIICLFLFVISNVSAQQEKGIIGANNWLNGWTEFKPSKVDYGEPTQILSGNISKDTKLYKRETYLLLGSVFVTDSTTLTIEPGAVIIGDYKTNGSLTITNGSTIIADGLETDPIVFTSNRSVKKAGDWGGLFILGDAPINKYGNKSSVDLNLRPTSYDHVSYGGDNIESNSGVLRYVRIEYAGKRTKGKGYFSGLTLAGVGNKTIVEDIMVSFSQGDSYELIGGDVNLNKMISYRAKGNDYSFTYGAQCYIYNSLAIRSSFVSGVNGSRCLALASYKEKNEVDLTKPGTYVNAQNLTLINVSKNLDSEIKMGLVKEAIFVDNDTSIDISKSVISGFNPAVVLDEKIRINNESLAKIKFTEMYFNNCNGNIFKEYNSNNEDLENWYGNSAFFNVYSKSIDSETFIDITNIKRPDYRLRINKIIASSKD